MEYPRPSFFNTYLLDSAEPMTLTILFCFRLSYVLYIKFRHWMGQFFWRYVGIFWNNIFFAAIILYLLLLYILNTKPVLEFCFNFEFSAGLTWSQKFLNFTLQNFQIIFPNTLNSGNIGNIRINTDDRVILKNIQYTYLSTSKERKYKQKTSKLIQGLTLHYYWFDANWIFDVTIDRCLSTKNVLLLLLPMKIN